MAEPGTKASCVSGAQLSGTVRSFVRGPRVIVDFQRFLRRMVGIAVPGGIEEFFAEAERTTNDHDAGRSHGIEFVTAARVSE